MDADQVRAALAHHTAQRPDHAPEPDTGARHLQGSRRQRRRVHHWVGELHDRDPRARVLRVHVAKREVHVRVRAAQGDDLMIEALAVDGLRERQQSGLVAAEAEVGDDG